MKPLLFTMLTIALPLAAYAASPLIVAHRGESHLAPENTMAAFELAWSLGDPAAECDVHVTADGKLIISHDASTKRTGGTEMVIAKSALQDLLTVDVGTWKDKKFAGQRMPTLEQLLASVPDNRQLLIEVKSGPETVPPLQKAIAASGKTPSQLIIISFKAPVVADAKRLMPAIPAQLLSDFKQDKETKVWSPTVDQLIASAKAAKADGLGVSAKAPVDRAFIEKVHAAGLKVNVWTIDSPEDARRYIDYGADTITTNRSAWMRQELGLKKE